MPTTPTSALTWPRPADTHPSTAPCPARDPAGGSLLAFATGYVYRVGISSGHPAAVPRGTALCRRLVGGGLLDLLTIAGLAAGLRERLAEPARPRPLRL